MSDKQCPFCKSTSTQKRGFSGKEGIQRYSCNTCRKMFSDNTDMEIVSENVKLAKKVQKFQDSNRIERKGFREHARLENALESLQIEIRDILKNNKLDKFTIKHERCNSKSCGIIQLSDTHWNELIDIVGNKYDFNIAAKRMKKFAIKSKIYFKANGITNILLALTGDLLNHDKLLDKVLNQATNRANAVVLSFYLLQQFIIDLNKDFNILIASVSGNEGRIDKDRGYSDYLASNNYDFTLENMLRIGFANAKGISFVDGDCTEKIVSVAGHNILMVHGDGLKSDSQKEIQSKIGSYALRGIIINYVIFGHIHSPNLSSHSSRSGSMPGSNDYNEKALGVVGRASQNIYIFSINGDREAIMIDLQDTGTIIGYDIIKHLEAYNAKSVEKLRNKSIIFQVVI